MKKKKIYLIAWYFPSMAGGAEKSILEELKIYRKKGYEVKIISFDEFEKKGKYALEGFQGANYHFPKDFSKLSRLISLQLNKKFILSTLRKHLKNIKQANFVITQTLIAPIVAEFCQTNDILYHYYLRDNVQAHRFENQFKGMKWLAKEVKNLLELTSRRDYICKNRKAVEGTTRLVANSDYMAETIKKNFGKKADAIIYPKINLEPYKKVKIDKKKQKYVTIIGAGDVEKGWDVFEKIVSKMPEVQFLAVGKFKKPRQEGNLLFYPWQKDVLDIYKMSKVVIAVSRWSSTFSGRVPMEVAVLGIGLVTTVAPHMKYNKKKVYVLKNIGDELEWMKGIKKLL